MRQKQTILKLMLLLTLVLWSSGTAWARTSTYKIVNNKGEVVMHVKGTTASPQLPVKAQSPFATDYRYYRYLEEAQLDASDGAEAAASNRLTGNLTYDGDVFVRYSYNPNGNVKDQDDNTLRIDGNAVYNFTICDYPGGTDASKKQPIVGTPDGRYVYYNSSSVIHHSSLPDGIYEKVHIAPYNTTNTQVTGAPDEASKKTKAFQWRFVGQRNGYEGAQGLPDPYDIRIINVADNSKVLTGIYTRTYDQGPTTQQYIHLTLLAPDNDATHVQRFFIRKLSNTVQIAASAPLYLYLGGTTEKNMWFVLNKEPNEYLWTSDKNSFKEHDCFQTLHMRIHAKQEDAGKIDGGSERRSALQFYRLTTRKYIILDDAGNKLAAANATADEMDQLQVPASIASALPGTSYRYWANKNQTGEITTNENLPDVVYVTYSFDPNTVGNQVDLNGNKAYNMKLNGKFVKYQVGAGDDSDVTVGTAEASDADEYVWLFKGGDPYKMQLTSAKTGAGYITGESTGGTISLHTGDRAAALKSNATASGRTPSTYYLVKSPAYTNENPVYLLRATYVGEGETSADDDDDPNFYTWSYGGDASDWNESQPRLYSSAFKEDVDADFQMQLDELLATPVTYHIIDKTKHEDVIQASTRKIPLDVPASIKSPLVSEFRYYDTQANASTDDGTTGVVTSTNVGHIYVAYTAGTEIKIDVRDTGGKDVRYKDRGNQKDVVRQGTFYVLKFLNGENYYHEDGDNGITTELKKAEVPYANGDACMNVYDEAFTNKKLQGGGSERTRMPWALIGGDPYRLKISAYQNSHKLANGSSTDPVDGYNWYFSYFRTYYNEVLDKVITANVTDDPLVTTDVQFGDANAVPTEYMVLGTKGKYKLLTTDKIDDGTGEEHRTVNTFEQYWKNYETIGQKLGTYETINNVKVVTSMPSDVELQARGWHKYPAWAYSKPLDGSAKEYDYQTHWFQTFEMGEEFDLIEVSLTPSIVLLDNHGWEIFRHPMTEEDDDKKFIKSYDSPMVKTYHWYKKGEKVTGYHKFRAYDPGLDESGEEEYTSTSLINYPPGYATNPGDWYVTYEVKDEYSYLYDDNNGSPLSAPCLIGSSSTWAKASGSTITTDNSVDVSGDARNLTVTVSGDGTISDAMLWYLKPNPTIDTEMGYAGSAITYTTQQKGFDPYNIQVRNGSLYFKTNATDASFNDQEWSSTTDASVSLSSAPASFTATGADNVIVHPTNFTFMALKDADGYIRLVPRFDHLKAITNLNTLTEWDWGEPSTPTTQGIRLQPIQKYKFEVRDGGSSDLVASSSSAFYATPGASLYTQLGELNIPLHRDLIRSYCNYPAAYTSYTSDTNTYDHEVTYYPMGDGSGISSDGVVIYVPFYVTDGLFTSVESPSWYNISFNDKHQFLQANASTHAVSGSGAQTADVSKWAFIGNPYDLKIINKADANTYFLAMNTDGNHALMSEGDAPATHWTLVYNDNGAPIMRLTTQIGSKDAYIKKAGEATKETTYPNGDDYKIFLTNLVTVTYHVCHGTAGTASSWSEDYTESLDYEVTQLEDYQGLPATVALPLCTFKYYKTEEDMQAGTNIFNSFSELFATLSETEKNSNMNIYLSYDVQYDDASSPVKFFATEAEARASMEWSFLMQGVESAAIVYGTQNKDYGHEHARMGKTARTYGSDIASLKPAERTFTQHSDIPVMGGFHFIRRTSALQVDAATGAMTVPETNDSIGLEIGARYIPSQNAEVNASLMSPLNDFRRIAETYKDGKDTKFRENSWLWAFIGTPYKFEIINREALVGGSYNADNMPEGGTYKRLAQVVEGGVPYLKLVTNTTGKKIYWTLEQLDNYGDDETKFSFHIKSYDENKIMSRTSATTSTMRTINTPPTSDIAYLKSTAFMAYPWNWSDTKYKTVTVKIYKNEVSGTPVLTKTYTRADRAFMAGDVIDGTDGHFYLPQQGTADGTSWKEKGVVSKTMPYDDHKINIPYELRRRYCNYTVEGGSFTVADVETPQTLNIIYTVPSPPNAPYFVPADQASAFRSTAESGTFNGVSKKNYYYFVDLKDNLSQYFFVNKNATAPTYTATSNTTRFAAQTAKHAMFYFVGDPYDLRICNSFVDKDNSSSLNLTRNTSDNTTFMDNAASSWEMVDANTLGSYGYNPSAAEVGYRLDYLQGKAFALRAKNSGANDTYYYLGQDGSTYGDAIYTSGSTPQENQLAAFRDYPDSRHLANGGKTIITLMRPVTVNVSVYDQDEPEKLVTKNEESEFYAMSERFKGVPNNLQRNYCKYTWASEETKPSGINNRLTSDGYFVIPGETGGSREFNLYAKYEETDDSPFARLDEHGVPVLKKNPSKSPWYNMNIGTRWAFFNSNLTGQRYEIHDKTAFNTNYAGKTNDQTELTFPYAGSSLPNAKLATRDRFHKGLHWALVGDPYNFQIRCQRDIIKLTGEGDSRTPDTDASGNYIYSPAYIKGAPVDDATGTVVPSISTKEEATWWTWIRERSTNRYFLSESLTRRTEVTASAAAAAKANAPRRLPIDYPQPDPSVNPPGGTLNFKINTADTFQDIASNRGVIARGDSYGIGDEMKLLSVDDVDANNECFDANVIVYNKVNEPVATSGWDEYARENARSNGHIDTDVQRWGCTYHYWADETMTRYPFKTFNQKDENGNYLIQDKGIVYVTYDYDENLYSSASEYRWMDIFYNWDHDGHTQMEWVNSPENSTSKDKNKAWCDQIAQTESRDQKWAMIGDPYKFILYNYNRKVDATTSGTNAYYLYDNGTSIVNHDFAEFSPSREKQQGIYFTWKVDGANYGFTDDGGTTYYKPAGLPETFFNFNGAGADKVQTGYLAVCDMTKTSLTDHDKLLGSIVGYTTFDENAAAADKYMTETATATKRYLVMPLLRKAATVTFHLDSTGHTSLRDWATNPVFDFTTTDFGVDNTLNLPWMMRRQYCDYQFYVVNADGADPSTNEYVDALNYVDGTPSNAHRVDTRGTGYTDFWHDGATNLPALTSMEIPDAWDGKHVYIRVTYQPTADFVTSTNTGATDTEKAASVHWMNIANQEQGNMLQYTRSQNVIGNSKENGANATNDLLWAVEGDPYGFKLHNRYAVAGTGTTLNANWATVLTTGKVNSLENVNYTETAPNFTFDTEGDPIIKSAITYGAKGTADAFGTMSSESTTNAVYEAMAGNYDGAMLIHPVNACINVRNQNGKKYYGAFLFNGAPTDYPVQLNYLQEWEAMRNVYANWRLEKPSAEQLYGYFERAGFVGGLTPAVATANAALFNKIKNKVALSDSEYNTVWELVQNPANLVQLTDGGYYRLRAYSSFDTNAQVQEQIGGHYVSGFLHKKEKDFKLQVGENEYPSPLHFYERAGQPSNIQDLGFLYGNEWADGIVNRSLLEIPDPEFDPSSVFRISRESGTEFVKFETQGLVLNGDENALTLIDMPEGSDLAAKNGTLYFQIQDIGQTAFQIRSKADAITTPNEGAYFGYSPSQENQRQKYMLHNDEAELSVYGGAHDTHIHSTKWLLEPVGATATNEAGVTYCRPLKVKLSHMGENDYFTSVCFPFDVTLPYGAYAYSCQGGVMTKGDEQEIGGQKYHQLNIVQIAGEDMATVSEGWKVKSNNQVIPAGVPALLYVDGLDTREDKIAGGINGGSGSNTVIVPLILGGEFTIEGTPEQTDSVLNSLKNSPLKYSYLTGELTNEEITGDELVFVFGKFSGKLGFMRNANLDYTGVKNNRFLLHNKIYYLYDPTPSGSSANFVTIGFGEGLQIPDPVVDGVEEVIAPADVKRYEHDAIYDLQGRRVPRITQPGIYIINGRKVAVKRVNMD